MKRLFVLAIVLASPSLHAWADGPSCTAQATDKKLAGAAKTSFMKKCQADATRMCGDTATGKKLAGAAKTSFVKKCVDGATG